MPYNTPAGVFRLISIFLITIFSAASAGQLSGIVTDNSSNPLAGVNIWTTEGDWGAASDVDGSFQFKSIPDGNYHLRFEMIGYKPLTKEVKVEEVSIVVVVLERRPVQLSEVTVNGTVATAGKTPVTFSTVDEADILSSDRQQDIPQLLDNLPGVYTMSDGGLGLGDSRLRIRGFDEKRIQVLVNNIPVNNPETKEVSWGYWGMLSGSLQAVQVQRGVGSSLYGSGALGGLVNIITRDSPVDSHWKANLNLGQYGLKRIGFDYHSGILDKKLAFTANVHYSEGLGWRDNTAFRGLQYYFSARVLPSTNHTLKIILHGAPMMRALGRATASVAAFADSSQFSSASSVDGGSGRLNGWFMNAYGFGRSFNGNVHVSSDEFEESSRLRAINLADVFLMNASLDKLPGSQSGSVVLSGDRASMNNQAAHKPQLEIHSGLQIDSSTKLTSTAFVSTGIDWQDYVYPDWFIPRNPDGSFSLETMEAGSFWGGDQLFAYRDVHRFSQAGLLSALEKKFAGQEISAGFESRFWYARHGGMVFETLGRETVPVPIASVVHTMKTGEAFYDFTTTKPQATVFGHGMWQLGPFSLMTNLQYTMMKFTVTEAVPSNKNYPTSIDPGAAGHGGGIWTHSALWDDDGDSTTAPLLEEYYLWDYERNFDYLTPRLGLNLNLGSLSLYANQSWGVKEPEIRHFFGFGAPREDIELEKTLDRELGLRWQGPVGSSQLAVELAAYSIEFGGKLMEITIPEKANTPGYDFAGNIYVPIGDASYSGLEGSLALNLASGWYVSLNGSLAENIWGEPDYSEGAQRLYGSVAVDSVDYLDLDGNGIWNEGTSEPALHRNFVSKYGARRDVGMPELLFNGRLERRWKNGSIGFGVRHLRNIYVLEDNSEILTGAGKDDLFGTADDDFSATLPPVWLLDLNLGHAIEFDKRRLSMSVRISNLLDAEWWQRGDKYGVLPGAPRTVILSLGIE